MVSNMETVCQVVSQLPPGFRFQPTDQELIIHYLRKKVDASQAPAPTIIADIDLYKFNPWELPEKALFGEGEWFFFSPRDRKYPNGGRPNRATASGYWKATGTDKPILGTGDNRCLGVKKALVFYKGQPRKGVKTNWLMHEYRLLDSGNHSLLQKPKGSMRLDDWVLCRVKLKGSSAAESNGPTEWLCSPQTNTEKQEIMKQQVAEERSSPAEWSEAQLLGYLLGSLEGAEESSDAGSMRSSGTTFCQNSECYSVAQQDSPPHAVESALSSIKRKLSFTVLDELILMQPGNKRQQFWVGGQQSPTVSESVNQEFDEPFVFY